MENIVFVSPLRQSLDDPWTFAWAIFLTVFNPYTDYISYLIQSLDKQSLLFNFHISALTFSLLQIQHKQSFSLVLIPTETIFPTCFNPKIGNLRYLCNFSCFSFHSSEDYFQVHDYQLLLFIYVMKIQFKVITNNFILVLYQSKKIFSYFLLLFWFSEIFLQASNTKNI